MSFTFEQSSSVLFCALNRTTRPEPFQLARALEKKGVNNIFLATRECPFWDKPPQYHKPNRPGPVTTLSRTGGLIHPLMIFFEMISLMISEVPSPTVLSRESRQCRCTSNSSA